MKKIIGCFLLLMIAHSSFANTIIKGKVKNAQDNEIVYGFTEIVINNTFFQNYSLVNDSFEIRIEIVDPVILKLSVNENHIDFFVLPNDTFSFSFDGNDVKNTLQYHCKNMEDQKFTTGLSFIESVTYLALKPYKVKGIGWKDYPEDMMPKLNKQEAMDKAKFKQEQNNNSKYSDALKYDIVDTSFFSHSELCNGLEMKSYFTPSSKDSNDKVLSSIFRNTKNYERPELIRNEYYLEFMNDFDYYQFSEWLKLHPKELSEIEWTVERVKFQNQFYKNQEVKYALMNFVNGKNNKYNADAYIEVCKKVKDFFPKGNYQAKVTEILKGFNKLMAGSAAPDFTLKDTLGKSVSLSDFKGKVVYIDFWAAWCLPCKIENVKVKSIKEAYANKDVVFLYITKDFSETVWEDVIKDQNIKGVHLMGNKDVFATYKASGVPTYILVNKEGNIVTNNPPRPSDEKSLTAMLDEALAK